MATPTIDAVDGRPFDVIAGGIANTLLPGVRLDYGISLAGSLNTAADGTLVLDMQLSSTSLDVKTPKAVTVGGYTVHTICSATQNRVTHLFTGSDTTCDVVVTPLTP